MPDFPNGGEGAEFDNTLLLSDVEELQAKLADSKHRIYGALHGAVPTVEIQLPRLDPNALGQATARAPRAARTENEPLVGEGEVAQVLPEDLRRFRAGPTLRERQDIARAEEEQARAASAVAAHGARQLAVCAAASSISVAAALGLSAMELGTIVGPVISAVTSCAICMAGLAHVWKARSNAIFDLLSNVFGKLTDSVLKVLDTIDDMLQGPLDKLEGMIDEMVDEQQPTLMMMGQFEDTMKKMDPYLDVPDPQNLKRPLYGCEAVINEIVDEAKREVPGQLSEAVRSTRVGRLATDRVTFSRLAVYAPLVLVFLLNLTVALTQVAIAHPAEFEASLEPVVSEFASSRRLRGSLAVPTWEAWKRTSEDWLHWRAQAPEDDTAAEDDAAAEAHRQLVACVQPALLQAALSILQTLAMLLLTQMPRVCGVVNGRIAALQSDLNGRVNKRVEGAVDRVFGQAFGEVRGKADEFFPKFSDSVEKLKGSIQEAAKLQAAAGAAADAAKKFGF